MKLKNLIIIIVIGVILNSCASIPKETVSLSKVIGNDLVILNNSHIKMVELYYDKIINDVNIFIDDVYAPFIIHYVLNAELEKYTNGEESLYSTIERAGKVEGKSVTDSAVVVMTEFLNDANKQIEKKRSELLDPIKSQENEILDSINQSYKNIIYANTTITSYLESTRKIKESQEEALSLVGLRGTDEKLDSILLQASNIVNIALEKGKEIDIKSDEALEKINEISNEIKNLTNK